MGFPIALMIDYVWKSPKPPPGTKRRALDRTHPDNFKYFRNWGFTIYRTYYGPESDESWNTLLQVLTQQTRLALGYHDTDRLRAKDWRWANFYKGDKATYPDLINIMKRLFRLFPREDPDRLAGLDVAGIRKLCLEEGEQAESEKNMVGTRLKFVLVADEAVLKDIANDIFVVKTVGYDWDPIQDSRSWGWMRLATGDLLEFWEMILMADEYSISKYYDIFFKGSEEDLEKHVWWGSASLSRFGDCSRVQTACKDDKFGRFRFDP
ncbi:hypothetical protein FPOAC2_07203 [Fusarium poae]|jgi:hypothetical protein|uniref:hypothetical protein n=1 Tax=Fusarium poae TaxID=36050 RepID=UPI001CE85880|nr:hypothetical protein FPOAC1_007057 [Fusarium poae]KAG8673739.1 hypothetical protein FPOAC1_007057 [Fusarium poae]